MAKISKISIVHSVSRKYETALKVCLKTCEDNAVKIEDVFSVNDKNLLEQVSKTDSELVLVIGGDGTMISTIRKLLILNIPFLGINIGKLGFLTDINLESISDELPKVFNAEYVREKRPFLEITLSNKDKKTAINEVVFHSGKVAEMMSFSIYKGDKLVSNHKSDGVIISSATGSTGYCFSGGGPIIHPTLSVFAIMPMFSQSSASNPLIVPSDEDVTIKLANKNKASIVIDGYTDQEIKESLEIKISQKDLFYELIHPLNYDYFEACRTKLSWGNPLVNIHD
ncbi:MAG: NAD(+)/NADH kinase [Gammaproteobacteria bacterium]|tara:strand:+ start:588 stop:1436 length:849 start_codon:yes stop_codon:yes gene_type:complete